MKGIMKTFSVSVMLLIGIFSSIGYAQQTFDVGVVDLLKTFETSLAGKDVINQLASKEQEIKDEIADIDKQAQTLQVKYNTQKLTLTMDVQQQLLADLDRLRTKRERVEEDGTIELRSLQLRLFGKLRNEILPVIDNVAREKGFSLVLDISSGSVVYFNESIDLTDEVVKRFDLLKRNQK